jgi:hypothetical protein
MERPKTSLRRLWSLPTRPRTIVRRRPTKQQLCLEQLEGRLVPTVSLLNHFDGMNVSTGGGVPPDTCGAAGPNSYIETVNSAVTITNKSTNAQIASDGLRDFLFTKGGLSSSWGLNDATMAYDEVTGQFVVGDLGLTSDNASALNIAVSKNSNPTTLDSSSWNFYTIDMTEANESGDYPGNMGFNADAFVFTFNMFPTNSNGDVHVEVAALSQSSLAAGASVFVNRFDESGFSWRPVTMHNSSPGGPMWFVTEHGDNTTIDLERIDNVLTSHSLHTFNMGVDSYDPINAPLNPDGSVITTTASIDTRIMKAAENVNNEIVACQAVGYNSNEDAARWYEFSVSNPNSPSLLQQGSIGFGPNTYTVYPSIDINTNGEIAMGFSKSGTDFSTDFMSAYITGHDAVDGSGVNENPVEIKAGDSNNHDGREGDFSGINIDPSDGTFWVADEFTTGGSWGTEVAQFEMNLQSFSVVNGQLDIFGDQLGANTNDSASVSVNGRGGVYAVLNGEAASFDPGQITSILIELGGGSNFTSVNATPFGVPTHIVSGGSDTVTLGNGTTQNILGDVNIENPPAFTNIIVNDATDTGSRTVTLSNIGANSADSQGNSDPWGRISGLLGNGNINYEYADTQNVTLQTGTAAGSVINVLGTGALGITDIVTGAAATFNVGNGGSIAGIQGVLYIESPPSFNTININDSADSTAQTVQMGTWTPTGDSNWGYIAGLGGAANINYEYADTQNVTLQTGTAAGSVINVLGTGALGITDIVTGAAATFNVGNGGSVAGIQGVLYIEGPPASIAININDSADSTAQTVQMGTWTPTGDSNWGYIAGLGGGANINYEYADTRSLTLQTGIASGNVINVLGTGVATSIQSNADTTINVGNGTVAAIVGTLNLESPPAFNTIVINDASDTHARTVTVSNIGANPSDSQGNSDPWGQVGGLAPANINFEFFDTNSVTIDGSNAGSTYNIHGTGTATTVVGGVGNDIFNLGSGNSLSALQGALTLNGGGGTNTVNANDSSSASGQSYSLSETQLAGSDFATVTYAFASLHALNVTGSGNDTLTILSPAPVVATTFNAGSGANTLVGPNVTTTWTISGANSGKMGHLTFSNFQNLVGGTGSDAFDFTTSTASLSGAINGGGGTNNNNTISYATLGSSYLVTMTLTSNTAGSATHIGGGFSNINTVVGSTDTANTLTGPNSTNQWTITGNNAGNVNTGPTRPFVFTSMANLVGGTGVDTFRFDNANDKVLSINGGGAPSGQGDWLKYSLFPSTGTVAVNLATGSATNVNGGAAGAVTNIQNVLGSATGTNNLTGDSQGNILIGGSGLNTLVGGSGNSLLIGGSGHGSVNGGSGTDILIAGGTTYNASTIVGVDALMAILAELQSADTFAQKVSDLTNGNNSGGGHDLNGSNKLTWGGTVRASSGTSFTLSGDTSASSNPDWFFSSSPSTVSDFNDDGVQDQHNNNAMGVF